jgi:four helix bundle protein
VIHFGFWISDFGFQNASEDLMDEIEMKRRTKAFALRCMQLADALPQTATGRTIGGQLVRSATSVAANYRSACRGRSRAEFAAKLGVVEEEADESALWLELIVEGSLKTKAAVQPLWQEADEIVPIIVASLRTLRAESKIRDPESKM